MRVRVEEIKQVLVVVEIAPEGAVYHPDVDALFQDAPEDVRVGWLFDDEHGEFFAPPGPSLADIKIQRQGELLATTGKFIEAKPNGFVRYDTNLKLNLMQAALKAAPNPAPEPAQAVETWIAAVQVAYFERKAALAESASVEALAAVDVSYGWFEARYGVGGSVHPDPDVSTEMLVAG